jgi:hypothetical protein
MVDLFLVVKYSCNNFCCAEEKTSVTVEKYRSDENRVEECFLPIYNILQG